MRAVPPLFFSSLDKISAGMITFTYKKIKLLCVYSITDSRFLSVRLSKRAVMC
jgi:hypothetical protein